MKPSFNIPKPTRSNDNTSTIVTASHLLPKNMRCPNGTVLIKRIQKEDLALLKYKRKMFRMPVSTSSSSSMFANVDNDPPPPYHTEVSVFYLI